MSEYHLTKVTIIICCLSFLLVYQGAYADGIVTKAPRQPILSALPTCRSCCSVLTNMSDCLCVLKCQLCFIESEIEDLKILLCSKIEASTESIIDFIALETGSIIDIIMSGTDVISSQLAACCSFLDQDIRSISDQLDTRIDIVKSDVDSVSTKIDALHNDLVSCCDMLSIFDVAIQSNIDSVSTKIDAVSAQLASCCDTLSNLDEVIKSDIDAVGSRLDFCCSFLDVDILSVGDVLETKLDCGFGVSFGQSDIPFVINVPGTYILCEDIQALVPSLSMITVQSDDVIINLNGHHVVGNAISGTNGLIAINTRNNVAVRNGVLSGSRGNDFLVTDAANIIIENIRLLEAPGLFERIVVSNSEYVTVQLLEIEAGIAPAISVINNSRNTMIKKVAITGDGAVPALVATNNTVGTILDAVRCAGNVTGNTVGIQSVNDSDITIKNCSTEILKTACEIVSADNFAIIDGYARALVAGANGAFIVRGPSCQNGVLSGCTVSGADTAGYIFSNTVSNVALIDCLAIDVVGGFSCNTVSNFSFENCIVEKSSSYGFSLVAVQQVSVGESRAHKCLGEGYLLIDALATDLIESVAQSVGTGISVASSSTITVSNCQVAQATTVGIQLDASSQCMVENCIVNSTNTIAYVIQNGSDSVLLENCRALNATVGFSANRSNNLIFKNCMIEGAITGDGFTVTNAQKILYDQSIALNCAGNGFNAFNVDDILYTQCSVSNAVTGFALDTTNNVLYCECAAHANNIGQFIAATCTHTVIRECCVANNTIINIDNLAADTDILCIDDLVCAIGKIIPLTQDNFNSGPVTITHEGHYKLCENITATTTLSINVSDVSLDFGAYYMDGVTISVAAGVKNIAIKNGKMRNVPFFIDIGSNTQNIAIENMVFDTITPAITNFGIRVAFGPLAGLTIKDVIFYNGAPSAIILNSCSNIILENIQYINGNQALPAVVGVDAVIFCNGCSVVHINNFVITDPCAGADAISIVDSDQITMNNGTISTTLGNNGNAAGIRADSCLGFIHDSVSITGRGFFYGFLLSNSIATSIDFTYRRCNVFLVSGDGFSLNSDVNAPTIVAFVLAECTALGCLNSGISIQNVQQIEMRTVTSNDNGLDGIQFNLCSNGQFSDLVTVANSQRGFYIANSSQVIVNNSSFLSNTAEGAFFNVVDNIVISSSESQKNGATGFLIRGVNGGNIPGDPEGNVGRSPVFVENCSAFQNGATGIYFNNVGGIHMTDCFSSYNVGNGFHCDSGSWNVQVVGCVATSNRSPGFLTWDSVLLAGTSKYNNRFHDCHASQNGTGGVYVPGLSDYSVNNSPGTAMVAPIGGTISSGFAAAPDPVGVVPPDFCTFF